MIKKLINWIKDHGFEIALVILVLGIIGYMNNNTPDCNKLTGSDYERCKIIEVRGR